MKRAGKTIECFNDIRKYLFEHKVPALTFIRDGKTEILYTQMYIDEKDNEIERLNNEIKILLQENNNKEKVIIKQDNIINELEKMLLKLNDRLNYEEDFCLDTYDIDDILDKLKELKESGNNDK